jgi:hypothetical protein
MKYPVKRFKDPAVALKELEPFVRNGEHLQTGKPFDNFGGMRSREILANWLVCVSANAATDGEFIRCARRVPGRRRLDQFQASWLWPTGRRRLA